MARATRKAGGDSFQPGQAETIYNRLSKARNSVLTAARSAAKVTIPGLIPEEGASDPHDTLEQPWTSMGARGVNNVSAKILLTMFPPERPFFRLDIDADTAAGMGAALSKAQAALAGISRSAMILAEQSSSRTIWMEVFRHLVVAGNVLTYHPDDGTRMQMWRLDQYVVRRNSSGDMIQAVIKDEIYPSELDDATRVAVDLDAEIDPTKDEKKVSRYTVINLLPNGQMEHFEEINKAEVPGSRGSVEAIKSGWQALRWQAVPGSDYGRAYVTEYAGDFLTLEDATKAIVKFAAEAARILRIVDPNSGLDIEELAEAESGDFLVGYRDRIQTLQLEKSQDFQIVWNLAENTERRLSQAFLMASNTIRNAERVTAEEVRAVAQELEDALGGTYTVLSAEVQRPYASRLLHILSKSKKAPVLPDTVVPVIVTGFNALGQNHETQALLTAAKSVSEILGPGFIAQVANQTEMARRILVGFGVQDVDGLLKTEEQQAQEAQAAQQNEAAMKATPEIAKGAVGALAQESTDVPTQ